MLQYVNYIYVQRGAMKSLSSADVSQIFPNGVSLFFFFFKLNSTWTVVLSRKKKMLTQHSLRIPGLQTTIFEASSICWLS